MMKIQILVWVADASAPAPINGWNSGEIPLPKSESLYSRPIRTVRTKNQARRIERMTIDRPPRAPITTRNINPLK